MKGYLTFTKAGNRWYDVVQRLLAYKREYPNATPVLTHHEWVLCEGLRLISSNTEHQSTIFVNSDVHAQVVKNCVSQMKFLLEEEPDAEGLREYFAGQLNLHTQFDELRSAFTKLMDDGMIRIGELQELLVSKDTE